MQNSSVSLGNGIQLTEILDPKFKTCGLFIRLFLTRDPEKAAVRALVIDLLTNCSKDYPTLAALSLRKQWLYGAAVSSKRGGVGDVQELTISASWLDDRFALDGESVTDAALDLTLGCLLNPNAQNGEFDAAAFKFAKQNLLDTIDCEINQKRGYALTKSAELAYVGEPAACPPYGTRESAEKITPASAYAAWEEMLAEAQIEIVAVTPSEKPQIREKLAAAFADIQNRRPQDITFETPSPCKAEVKVTEEEMPVTQCKMVLVLKTGKDQPVQNDAMRMLNLVLGCTTGSLLFTNVREKRSLCYYCASRYQRTKHALLIDCGVRTEQIDEAREAILEQVEMMKNGEFTDAQMEEAILSQANAYASATESHVGYATWVFNQKVSGSNRTMEEALAALKAITREQVVETAKLLQLDTIYVLRAAQNETEGGLAE